MINCVDDELAVFDMLGLGKKISDKENAELKATASKLLNQFKSHEFKIELWADKEQTKSAVRTVINNYLFENLPFPLFSEPDIKEKTDVLFDFFKGRDGDYGAKMGL